MAKRIQKTKLVLKDIVNPKKVAANFPEGSTASVVGGSIMGLVSKVVRGMAKAKDGLTDVETVGLGGTFEGIPADPERDTVISGVCYLSAAFQDPIIDILEVQNNDGKWIRNPQWDGRPIQMVAQVHVTPATNPQGYSWALEPVGELTMQVDPLAELRAKLMKPAAAQIEKPKEKAKA